MLREAVSGQRLKALAMTMRALTLGFLEVKAIRVDTCFVSQAEEMASFRSLRKCNLECLVNKLNGFGYSCW